MSWLTDQPRIFLASVGFLTRIPVSSRVGFDPAWLARGTPYFPLVGLVVGGLVATFFLGFCLVVPFRLALALALGLAVGVTGAFHEDGLADTLDGLGGGRGRDEALLIMKDSRVGTYGAVGLVLALLVSFVALSELSPPQVARTLVTAHVLGRWSSLPLIWRYPYLHPPGAEAKPFAASVTGARLWVGSLLAAVLVTVFLGWRGAIAGAGALVVTVASGLLYRRRIGGITGDCLGATNKCVEVGTYVLLASRPLAATLSWDVGPPVWG